jgi:hypothetical protein
VKVGLSGFVQRPLDVWTGCSLKLNGLPLVSELFYRRLGKRGLGDNFHRDLAMASGETDGERFEDNRAEVMMEAGLGFVRAGDLQTALSFFADAAYLFRERRDERSAGMAQAWLDAGSRFIATTLYPASLLENG